MSKRPMLTTILSIVVILLVVALLALFQAPSAPPTHFPEISYTQLLKLGSQLREVTIRGDELTGYDTQNRPFKVRLPNDPALATRLADANVDVRIGTAAENWQWTLLTNLVPLIIYFLLFGLPLFRIARALESLAGRRLDTRRARTST